tara:strand:+ start:2218 stop:3096 length:879 start_codon:yes stop_codon:yes gene_type:complete
MRERCLKKIKSLIYRNKMSLKVSNSSYTIPKETDKIEQPTDEVSNFPGYDSSLALTPISPHSLKEDEISDNEEEDVNVDAEKDNPDINDSNQQNNEEISSEDENEKKVTPPEDIENVKLEEPDKREYYMRIARTLLIILAVIILIYFVNWLLKNIFKIDLYQLAKDKILSLPIISGISALFASSWFNKSNKEPNNDELDASVSESSNTTSLPVNILKDSNDVSVDDNVTEEILPNDNNNNTTSETPLEQPSDNVNEEQPQEIREESMNGPEMKQVLSESIEKSLVNLLTQFK